MPTEQFHTAVSTCNIREGFFEVSFRVKAHCKLFTG